MKILVTGGAGFIGSHVLAQLQAAGVQIRVLDNLSTGKRDHLAYGGPALEFIEGDIADAATVAACTRGIEAIIHLAAVASVQASIDDPLQTHRSNFDGTLNLLEAARVHGVKRFIYASSAAIYGDTEALPVAETEKPNPLSPYAIDKLAGEYYLQYYARKHGLNTTAFRFFNIYGPRQDPSSPYSGVMSIFMDRLGRDQPLTIFGDGQQTRDFVYVADLAALLVRAVNDTRLAGQVMNVGMGKEQSLLQIVAALERLSGKKIACTHAPARMGDIVRSCADISRLRQLQGSVPNTPLQTGLMHLMASVGLAVPAAARASV